ncbi:MAG: hypothetical protein MR669_06500 [Selenomonadaceae bacterium]|nr:hypothetical protein [Selenomonadaceae bacterium]
MPIETGNVTTIRPAGSSARTDGTGRANAPSGASEVSGFSPRTDVSIRSAVSDMAGVLSKVAQSQTDAVEQMPQELQQVVEKVLQQAFSVDESLVQGLGSMLESQRFTIDQLSTLSRMLGQMANLAESGGEASADETMQTLLTGFKNLLSDSGTGVEPVLLTKAAFELLDNQEVQNLPKGIQNLLTALSTGENETGTRAAAGDPMQLLVKIVRSFMPPSYQEGQSATGEARNNDASPAVAAQTKNAEGTAEMRAQDRQGTTALDSQAVKSGVDAEKAAAPGRAGTYAGTQTGASETAEPTLAETAAKTQTPQQASEGRTAEVPAAGRGATEVSAAERGATEVPAAERGATEASAAERGATKVPAAERGVTEASAGGRGTAVSELENAGPAAKQAASKADGVKTAEGSSEVLPSRNSANAESPASMRHISVQEGVRTGENASRYRTDSTQTAAMREEAETAPNTDKAQMAQPEPAGGRLSNPAAHAASVRNGAYQAYERAANPVFQQPLQPDDPDSMQFAMTHAKNAMLASQIQNTPEAMQTLRNIAALLLQNGVLSDNDTALLQNFLQGNTQAMPQNKLQSLQNLLRLCQQNIPTSVQQAAIQQNIPDLPKVWSFMQLADMTNTRKMNAAQLKRAAKDISSFATSLKHAMTGDSVQLQDQRTLDFMQPVYLNNGKVQYPAYIHVYDENKQDAKTGERKKETWFRVCMLTQHIGAIELTCRVYDEGQLDMRMFFSNADTAEGFIPFIPEIKDNLKDSTLHIRDFHVDTEGA